MKFSLHHFELLSSTNDKAADIVYSSGDVIVAEFQSEGRGQRGNHWESAKGENLTFSIVVEPSGLQISEHFKLSMVASLCVARCVESLGIEGVEVKWPNDILVQGRKISGVLIENSLMGPNISRSIIGIGLNVRQGDFSEDTVRATNPTSLLIEGVEGVTTAEVLELILGHFSTLWELSAEELHREYTSMLFRGSGSYPYRDCQSGEEFIATIEGIDPHSGQLSLRDSQGMRRQFFFKEVEVI